ncbi:hypothetical protein EGW08_012834, partial [Elysia chlorotica]
MTVLVHTNITMKCVLQDLQGDVQWTKDGFGFSFNRSVPGQPRISITGNDQGYVRSFNLHITDVQLSDDDKYTCQVSPGHDTPPLIARATLTVTAPPEEPFIENYSNNSKVEVHYNSSSVQLVCVARAGKPAVNIFWYRDGQRVTENIEYETIPLTPSKKVTARSKLTISLDNYREENQRQYKCEVQRGPLWTEPLRPAVVTLDIL